jgi:hypothetical protein
MTRLPTLTPAGWVNDVVSMGVKLMDYFLVTEHSQSHMYRGNITSMTYLVQQHGNRPEALSEHTRANLQIHLARYFDEVQVNTTVNGFDSPDGRYNLSIDVLFTKDGKQHSLGRLLEVGESKILSVTDGTTR